MKTLPDHVAPYKKTPVFDQHSIPAGLLANHNTKAGTWGKIVVLEGALRYTIVEPAPEQHLLTPGHDGVVEPQMLHHVTAQGEVRFYVEFYR